MFAGVLDGKQAEDLMRTEGERDGGEGRDAGREGGAKLMGGEKDAGSLKEEGGSNSLRDKNQTRSLKGENQTRSVQAGDTRSVQGDDARSAQEGESSGSAEREIMGEAGGRLGKTTSAQGHSTKTSGTKWRTKVLGWFGMGEQANSSARDNDFEDWSVRGLESHAVGAKQTAWATLRPIVCNVQNPADLDRAVSEMQAVHGTILIAVVVNANFMGAPGPLEHVDVETGVTNAFDVNVIGALRTIQKTLPLLRKCNWPRIVLVSSGAGSFAPTFHGVYAMGKFALEALGDTLRRELPDVAVTIVQPEMIKTNAAMDYARLLRSSWTSGEDERYEKMRLAVLKQHKQLLSGTCLTPEQAARGVVHAACTWDKEPPARYRVGMGAVATAFLALLPASWGDFLFAVSQGRLPPRRKWSSKTTYSESF